MLFFLKSFFCTLDFKMDVGAMQMAKTGFQVLGAAGCAIAFFNSMAGLAVAAGSIFFLIVLDMIASPLTFLKTSIFNLIAFVFVAIYVSVCATNQEFIQSKSMPSPWGRNNVIIASLVMIHLIFMVVLPSASSLTMSLIAIFVAMQIVVARFFRTNG